MRRVLHASVAGLLIAWLLGGCASTPNAQFYTLGNATQAPAEARSTLSLALGPIDLPQYLDRPQIVTRDGDNRLKVDEFNRWGGSLEEEMHRVLAAQLVARLGTQRIYAYPSRIVAATDYRLALDIRGFDGTFGGAVVLDVAWSLIDDRTAQVVSVRQASYRGTVNGNDYGAYAAALGALLVQLGDELAADVAAHHSTRQ